MERESGQQLREYAELAEVLGRLAAIVEQSQDAIIGKTLDGIVTSWNRAAERMYGWTAEEMIGASLLRIFPPENTAELPTILERLRRGEHVEHYETVRIRKDGRRLDVSISISPIRNARGVITTAATIARDITERIQLEHERAVALAEAHTARAAAEAAVRTRDEFLSIAAHELRTPVTSLRGYAQILLRRASRGRAPDPELTRRSLKAIDQQSVRLARLVDQILDVSDIEAGQLKLNRSATDLVRLVRGAIAAVQAGEPDRRLRLDAPAALTASVDPARIERVLVNLLSNALTFSPPDAPVDIELGPTPDGGVRLAVRDRGSGIDPDQRGHIFDRFYQGHAGYRRSGGLGLGLYISRHIVELHGGTIVVEFPPDGGSCFVVTLPPP